MLVLSHKSLEVYKLGIKLVKEVYTITKIFPKDELYGLTSQTWNPFLECQAK